MKNIAIILASGTGTRFGAKQPKQFVKLAGKPVIAYTIDSFNSSNCIDEIIVVTNYDYIEHVESIVIENSFQKVTKVICGGKERYDSSWSAINAIEDEDCNVLLHDAVRPFVSHRIIQDCVSLLNNYNAVDVVADPTDTIVKITNNEIISIPNRRDLGRGQTPQGFKKAILKKAYEKFMLEENKIASDDCGIFLAYLPGEKIGLVKGEESNFKITHPQDLYLADNIIRDGLPLNPMNENLQVALENKVVVVFGGTSGIGLEISQKVKTYNASVYVFGRTTGHDISQEGNVSDALRSVYEIEGKIDFVINSAGVLIKKPLEFSSYKDIALSCGVNYVGAINVAKESFTYLSKSNGMLVNFTSSSYTRGRSNYSLYSSSKSAIVNLTQALSEEWLSHKISVNCINPERTDTPMRRVNFGIEPKETLLTAEQVAMETLSVMASNVTGQIVTVKR